MKENQVQENMIEFLVVKRRERLVIPEEETIDYSKIGSVAENALKVSKVPVILVK